jgi:O-antigen/teichoic acid export membrane protein
MRRTTKKVAPEDSRQRPWNGRLLQNAVALMVSSGGTAVLGLVFWTAATHLSKAPTVGRMSAEIAAMILLANLAQLSFGSIFERFLPVAAEQTRAFILRAYVMCISFAFIASIAYVFSGLAHSFIPSSFGWRALFVVAVVLWTIFMLQDNVLVGLRASRWVPVENILFSAAKLALIPAFIMVTQSQGIFLAWTAPVGFAIIAVNWYLFKTRIPDHMASSTLSEKLPATRELILLAGAQYATLIFNVFAPSIVTLIVIERLGPVANAHYYVPQLITTSLALFNWSIVRSFLVEAASDPQAMRRHANVTIGALTVVLVPSVVIGVILAPEILQVFGASYAADGTTLLRMLLLSLPCMAVTIFYSSFAWLDKHVWWMALRELASLIIFLGVMFVLIGHYGILSIGIASLVSSGIQAIFFLPISIRRYRMTSNTDAPQGGASNVASKA